ncbi:MAG TPA: sugar ABC transporter permease [Aliidongia sp.]|uniref:carbohydrate ABC transporter permease n=1 Tax=Aliidongia sp. TaxID=1914230 RepID=UPI002DDD8DB5|nr:sugar ABC transporter permease [Aliidongia sp.]HEV2677697.1 sugar ABC transporter permease [Aliidongia sp.]
MFLPAAIFLAGFTYYPMLSTLFDSFFTTGQAHRPSVFAGLDQYQDMVDDPIFWQALRNNALFALGTIPTSIGLALLMAIWVNGKIRGRSLLRMAYFTPTVLPMIAAANIWIFFYAPQIGPVAHVLGLFGYGQMNYLGSSETALACITVVAIWKEAGFFMIFYLAALQNMPPNLADAALIEGASRTYYFRRVTFPLLLPTTLFILINAVVNAFRMIDHIIVMTKGGPDNATMLLLYYIYQTGFTYWDSNYAAAMSVVLLLLLAVAALGQFLFIDRRAHYQ